MFVQPVFVLVNVFGYQFKAAENKRSQRREIAVSENGNCFYQAVALWRDATSD